MQRKEFLKLLALFGWGMTGLPTQAQRQGNAPQVLIIGAGAAGLSAAYWLQQRGIAFQVLEASATYGGRMKTHTDFVDFPLPMGAEWLSTHRRIFKRTINDATIKAKVPIVAYNPLAPYGEWRNGALLRQNLGIVKDQKFVGMTWLTFFETYLLPSIQERIVYQTPVQAIDYSQDIVRVQTATKEYQADAVIVTVPLKILQEGTIQFTPALPQAQQEAIERLEVWDGFKAFIEFSEAFYPTYLDVVIEPKTAGQLSYYDAAYGQKSDRHILGVFSVGAPARRFGALAPEALRAALLDELDRMLAGQASPRYLRHIAQHWADEPFIKGAYVNDHADWRMVARLGEPISERLYFAGDAYTDGEDWGHVHNAIESARVAVDRLLG